MLSVRVVCVDHYMGRPIYSLTGRSKDTQEPVIRVFGPSATGEKTCVHVHGVYPYMYVPYEGGCDPERDAQLLAAGIDRALFSADKPNIDRFVYKISVVSGIPMYGYHSKERQFFKIFFINPFNIRRAADLLMSGAILNQRFQPHESHIPYIQQFMIDFNIYGMSYIDLCKPKYRINAAYPDALHDVNPKYILSDKIKSTTYSYWEVDILAENIANKKRDVSIGANPGIKAIWNEEETRRRAQGRLSQITPQSSQSRPDVQPTATELYHRQRLMEKLKTPFLNQTISQSSGPRTPYPAELPDKLELMSASMSEPSAGFEAAINPIENLINHEILTQFDENKKHDVIAEEEMSDEEAELEDEGGLDLTQPLPSLDQEISSGSDEESNRLERGEPGTSSEDEFWKIMADKVFQVDGTGDPHTSSEEENNNMIDKIIDNAPELGSFMTEAESQWLCMLENSIDPVDDIFQWDTIDSRMTDFLEGSYTPTSTMSPIDTAGYAYTIPPPSAILTPASSEPDSTDLLGDLCQEDNTKIVTLFKKDLVKSNKNNLALKIVKKYFLSPRQRKSSVFKEYLKIHNIIEIINTEFKTLSDENLLVIEYKSAKGNTFLVKSITKVAEELKNLEKIVKEREKEIEKLIKPLEHKYTGNWLNKQQIEEIKNKFIVKSINFIQEEDERNEEVSHKEEEEGLHEHKKQKVSHGEKSSVNRPLQEKVSHGEKSSHQQERVNRPLQEKVSHGEIKANVSHELERVNRPPKEKVSYEDLEQTKEKISKEQERVNTEEKVSYEVNKSVISKDKIVMKFVKSPNKKNLDCNLKNFKSRTRKSVSPRINSESSVKSQGVMKVPSVADQGNIDPLQLISQVLSNYSSNSKTDLPPVSITINFGGSNLMLNSADGANDGSSDDAEVIDVTPKKKRKKKSSYKPLNVVLEKSPVKVPITSTPCTPGPSGVEDDDVIIVSDNEEPTPTLKLLKKAAKRRSKKAPSNCSSGTSTEQQKEKKQLESEESDTSRLKDDGPYVFKEHETIHQLTIPQVDVMSSISSDDEGNMADSEEPGICSFYDTTMVGEDISSSPYTVKEITPKLEPPSSGDVAASLASFNIPPIKFQLPFFSNPDDVTKSVEVGNRLLKIENYSTVGLKTFNSTVVSSGLDEKRNEKVEKLFGRNVKRSELLGENREIIITPLKPPPTRQEIETWMKRQVSSNSDKIEIFKLKIAKPSSPGDSDSNEDSFSLSPCTPNVLEAPKPVEVTILKKGPAHLIKNRRRSSLIARIANLQTIGEETSKQAEQRRISKDVFESDSSKSPNAPPCSHLIDSLSPMDRIPSQSKIEEVENKSQSIIEDVPKATDSQTIHLKGKAGDGQRRFDSSCNIEGISLENTFGFRLSVDNLKDGKAVHENDYLTLLLLELHIQTRGDLRPDPELDPIRAVFYTVVNDVPSDSDKPRKQTGVIGVGDSVLLQHIGVANKYTMKTVNDELALINGVVALVKQFDPDIIGGYEIEMLSWGYLIQRSFILEINLLTALSRTVIEHFQQRNDNEEEDIIPSYLKDLKIPGRIVIDVWRLFRHEVALTSYTFENVSYHVNHERYPVHSFKQLSQWWEHRTHKFRYIALEYHLTRVEGTLRLLNQLDLIGRTCELARLFGIQFVEVLTRGSQFRVESMMLRLAKPRNYIPVSPSITQRASMRAPVSLPLIMEPESKFYVDPVIVLDFQSLYPSMIIAYNYCFSTCLGRTELLGQNDPFEFGCTHLHVSPEELDQLKEHIHFSPVGVAFVKSSIRKGILPQMLEEILDTRLMVKKSMKENKNNKILQKVLHARQLGLKLIANVTYGYTAANFSGRMPCIEVGDSVVSKGRETLERAIELVKNTSRWGAKVIYGDTDSLFVMTPGKTRKEAFQIGAEIADAVTQDNPKPVKLKLEKVYQPCILQTKKRYVGHMYDTPDQEKPTYEAKGIETVRRDGCPAVAKILQKSLEILFDTKDVSLVKKYVMRQFVKLFQGRVNIHNLVYGRQYRGRRGYRPTACVPGLQLARQWAAVDKRAEPRKKERIPYVFVNGPPGVPLIRLVRSPRDLLIDPSLRINAVYYITKAIIPPLQRCFGLLGADVMTWYNEMPRKYHRSVRSTYDDTNKKSTISQYFATVDCAVCFKSTMTPVCSECQADPQKVAVILNDRIRKYERCGARIEQMCQSCCGRTYNTDCESLDCPVLYRRCTATRDLKEAEALRDILNDSIF